MEFPRGYLAAFETGPVATGDFVNHLPVELLDAEWVRAMRIAPGAVLVATAVKVGAPGGSGQVHVAVVGLPGAFLVPSGHAALAHHVRPAALAPFFSSVCFFMH